MGVSRSISSEVQILQDPPRSGIENMQIDDRLLLDATPNSPIVLRVYGWSEPTLSLGHFQAIESLDSDPFTARQTSLRHLPWVRRRTGGGAILHDRELTYSFVIPTRERQQEKGHSESLYRAVHESVRDGLIGLGLPASLSVDCTCGSRKIGGLKKTELPEPFLCFQRRTPVDVVIGEHKILGSAQRRTRTGLLQHGSLLLSASPALRELIGVEELLHMAVQRQDPEDGRGFSWDAGSFAGDAWRGWFTDRILAGLRSGDLADC